MKLSNSIEQLSPFLWNIALLKFEILILRNEMCHYLTVSDSDALRDTNLKIYKLLHDALAAFNQHASSWTLKKEYLFEATDIFHWIGSMSAKIKISLYRERAHTFALRLAPISPLITRAGNQLLSLLKVVSRHTENQRSSIHPWVAASFALSNKAQQTVHKAHIFYRSESTAWQWFNSFEWH